MKKLIIVFVFLICVSFKASAIMEPVDYNDNTSQMIISTSGLGADSAEVKYRELNQKLLTTKKIKNDEDIIVDVKPNQIYQVAITYESDEGQVVDYYEVDPESNKQVREITNFMEDSNPYNKYLIIIFGGGIFLIILSIVLNNIRLSKKRNKKNARRR